MGIGPLDEQEGCVAKLAFVLFQVYESEGLMGMLFW